MKALWFISAAIYFGAATTSVRAGDVSVTVSGIIPNGSRVYVAICAGDLAASACSLGADKPAQATSLQFVFPNVAPSRYAILAYQDLDGSGSLPRSKLGIPLEPFALSNGAGRTGKPTFEAAAVRIGAEGADFQLRLHGIGHRSGQ